MVEVEVDGRKVEVAEGSMLMQAANQLGIYIPHFCYHKKLSIAANCRMCLVEVAKAPKPLPACATPVSPGMKAFTRSEVAVRAQKGVMEFLLINHPLDCPICDQGGECQLQDLAVGYGASGSTYIEAKRVVFHKSIGPLVSANEMTRCIHCTRCIRFGQEIGGIMELGMGGRGEHSEIMSFLSHSIDSELSGNMIDICPVGALTSKPFRFQARTWELTGRRSVSPHDSLGSNLVVQVKQDRVMRVLPFENEAVNQCWLSDRDRFSYEGIDAPDRLTKPMIKQEGAWHEVAWETALEYVAHALDDVRREHGAEAIGLLASPQSTLEELYLGGALMRGIGSENIDFRLRQTDFSLDEARAGVPWLGHAVEEVESLDALLLVGSFLRKDHPLLSARVRAAAKAGTKVMSLHAVAQDLLMPVAARITVAPDQWVASLIEVMVACARTKESFVPHMYEAVAPSQAATKVAQGLLAGEQSVIWLGNAAVQHPSYGELARVVQAIAQITGARVGVIGEAANSVGGHLVGALPAPGSGGLNARAMVAQPRQAYLLMGLEPSLDCADPVATVSALRQAKTVVALTAYAAPDLLDLADCLLPITPFAETGGSFINAEGRLQTFNGVVRPQGQARPGWKVLRVLGNAMALSDFGFDNVHEVRVRALQGLPGQNSQDVPDGLHFESRLDNRVDGSALPPPNQASVPLQRVADVPINFSDPLVRRAYSLQLTADARAPLARLSAATMASCGVTEGARVTVRQDGAEVVLMAHRDDAVADGVVQISAAHPSTAALPMMFGPITMAPFSGSEAE